MKLIFDQNISFRIVNKLNGDFEGSKHVSSVNLQGKTDIEIWNYAKRNGFAVVTFDSDFFDLSSLKGHPPKIIWLRMGNTTSQTIAKVLNTKSDIIHSLERI